MSQVQLMELARALSFQAQGDHPRRAHVVAQRARGRDAVRDHPAAARRGCGRSSTSRTRWKRSWRSADEISIMRDGHMIGTWPTSELSIDQIITRMVGPEAGRTGSRSRTPCARRPLLEVRNLTAADPRLVQRRLVRRFAPARSSGSVGSSGPSEPSSSSRSSGSARWPPARSRIAGSGGPSSGSPLDAKAPGMALVTEDRRLSGIIPTRSVVREHDPAPAWRAYANRLG